MLKINYISYLIVINLIIYPGLFLIEPFFPISAEWTGGTKKKMPHVAAFSCCRPTLSREPDRSRTHYR
jgi:hypothetical protein